MSARYSGGPQPAPALATILRCQAACLEECQIGGLPFTGRHDLGFADVYAGVGAGVWTSVEGAMVVARVSCRRGLLLFWSRRHRLAAGFPSLTPRSRQYPASSRFSDWFGAVESESCGGHAVDQPSCPVAVLATCPPRPGFRCQMSSISPPAFHGRICRTWRIAGLMSSNRVVPSGTS